MEQNIQQKITYTEMKEAIITKPNVHVIDEAFYMPQLDRHRRIWLYLPPEYTNSKKKYPVIYMHDGQNLFEEATAFGVEWGVDEVVDSMRNKSIVVGIDNGGEKRGNEYTVDETETFGAAEGNQYLQFIVETLKPYIDKTFRTYPDREHTVIAGSSMGGLISFYGALFYPDVFGTAGIFSPSFWIAPRTIDILKDCATSNQALPQRFYFYAGEQEGENVVEHMQAVIATMKDYPQYTIEMGLDSEGDHSETAWRSHYPFFYKWVMKNLEIVQ